MEKILDDRAFEEAVRQVVDASDKVIVVYSAIWSIAIRFGGTIEDTATRIFDVLNDVAGDERTLLFPTFTNGFVKTRRFDLTRDLSDSSGVLANHALMQPGFRRTHQPIHSYVVRGPLADDVLAQPSTTAWGDDSVIAWMGKVNARFCPLGLPWHQACSYFHRIEEVKRVPYRYFKRFAGTLLDDGVEIGSCAEVKYAHSLNVPPVYDHTVVKPRLDAMKAIRTSENPLIPLQSTDAKSITQATEELFEDDLYSYVKNRDEVQAWIANGLDDELASLAADERWPIG